jgi:hypothetical protein
MTWDNCRGDGDLEPKREETLAVTLPRSASLRGPRAGARLACCLAQGPIITKPKKKRRAISLL